MDTTNEPTGATEEPDDAPTDAATEDADDRIVPLYAPLAAAALLIGISFLPTAAATVTIANFEGGPTVSAQGASEALYGNARWTWATAVALAVVALAVARFLEVRRPGWAAPAALSAASIAAFVLVTELIRGDESLAPYAERVPSALAEARPLAEAEGWIEPWVISAEGDPKVGAWLTVTMLGGLAVAALIWLGRELVQRSRRS